MKASSVRRLSPCSRMESVRFLIACLLIAIVCRMTATSPAKREAPVMPTLSGPPSLDQLWEIVRSDSWVDECTFGSPLKDDCETCSKLGKSPEAYYLCCGKDDPYGVRNWCQSFLNYKLPENPLIRQDR